MGLFVALRALYPVQNFVALVDSWSSLLLASKADRVVEAADDAPIPEMQFRREIKLNRHAAETPGCARGFAEKSTAWHFQWPTMGLNRTCCSSKASPATRAVVLTS